jgi:nucleotidyltransferase substrate binding protein (TIGR01987 family)
MSVIGGGSKSIRDIQTGNIAFTSAGWLQVGDATSVVTLLDRSGGSVKAAILLAAGAKDATAANDILSTTGQRIRPALERLKESVVMELQAVNDEFREALRDSVIQRFEFTVDLAWKVIKVLLLEKDIECSTPKDCLRTAFEKNILARDDFWLWWGCRWWISFDRDTKLVGIARRPRVKVAYFSWYLACRSYGRNDRLYSGSTYFCTII